MPEPSAIDPRARPTRRQGLLIAGAVASAAAGAYLYQQHIQPALVDWGASAAERATPCPGADLLPPGRRRITVAIDIAAPPADVWPWIIQMGDGRAGWYAYDLLVNRGRRSALRVQAEHQALHEGDLIPIDNVTGTGLQVLRMAQDRALILGWSMPRKAGLPKPDHPDAIWSYHLTQRGTHGTRLVLRITGEGPHPWAQARRDPLGAHFAPIFQRRHLLGIKDRSERLYGIHRARWRRHNPQVTPSRS